MFARPSAPVARIRPRRRPAGRRRAAPVVRQPLRRAARRAEGARRAGRPGAGRRRRPRCCARTKELAAEVKAAEAEQGDAEATCRTCCSAVQRHRGRRAGGRRGRLRRRSRGRRAPRLRAEGFEPRDHLELGELLGAIDIERGAKVSGARFYYLTGVGALLELALVNLAIAQAVEAGFTPMIPPALVKPGAMEGTGFLGQAAENVYHLRGGRLYLVGTSEVPLAAYHMDEILDAGTAAAALRRRSRRASAARPARTARTPAASSGCTSSTRSRCSRSSHRRRLEAEHQRLLAWEKRVASTSWSCRTG